MRALVASKYGPPSSYEISDLPIPEIRDPHDVLLRMEAVSISTSDTQLAAGMFRLFGTPSFPIRLGHEGAGIVQAVGSAVTRFQPRDRVFGAYVRKPVRPADLPRGLAAEWAVVPENFLLAIPDGTSFVDAAALASITVVAVQCFRTSLELMGINGGGGAGWERRLPLEGKTVFVPGALSATGSVGVQVAKNVFGASRVVSTVSTAKMPLVERLLGAGVVDELVDYKLGRKHVEDQVGRGRVDLSYNTQWDPAGVLRLTKPHSGVVVSIASVPTAETMRNVVGPIPFWVAWILGLAQLWYRWLLHGTGIKMEMILSSLDEREDLEMAGKWIAQGKVKAVTTVVDFDDIDAVRRECEKVKAGKGGLGKLVIKFQPQAP